MTKQFGVFVEYSTEAGWVQGRPLVIEAETAEEACRGANLLADFIHLQFQSGALILVMGPNGGRVVGEIRRGEAA